MLEKFRGTLYGVLIGDCCGALYEEEGAILSTGSRLVLRKYLDKFEVPAANAPKNDLRQAYTDDTALTLAVARTLISEKSLDQKTLATNFVTEYYKNVRRGYGQNVVKIFERLRTTKTEDPLLAARQQFNGVGSLGNGGAMRVAPIALFCYNRPSNVLIEMARKSAEITHTHVMGVNGTILQALAIHQLLQVPKNETSSDGLDVDAYLDGLEMELSSLESNVQCSQSNVDSVESSYCKQLKQIKRLLRVDPSDEQVVNVLGHSVRALYSVPTAIYCFLRSIKFREENKNPFRQSIEYAICLGGDTDTIASMTGALSGAYYGESVIPENLIKHCEGVEEIKSLSEQLYAVSNKT